MSDISLDDDGKVKSTRFRFQHKPLKSQEDFIRGLVETRRATDLFAAKLIPLHKVNSDDLVSLLAGEEYLAQSYFQKAIQTVKTIGSVLKEEKETEAPTAFTYSLYYVYYDQYTYISGVLA